MFLTEKEKHDASTHTKYQPGHAIGDDIKLTVLDVQGSQVRIGIAAPKSVPVHRSEIYHKIKQGDEDDNR